MNWNMNEEVARLVAAGGPELGRINALQIDCAFIKFNFVQTPLLSGPFENYAVAVDRQFFEWSPLIGNGINRDALIELNVQANGVDGRQDQILTEGGFAMHLVERHCVFVLHD
jgi:hypothetical protein